MRYQRDMIRAVSHTLEGHSAHAWVASGVLAVSNVRVTISADCQRMTRHDGICAQIHNKEYASLQRPYHDCCGTPLSRKETLEARTFGVRCWPGLALTMDAHTHLLQVRIVQHAACYTSFSCAECHPQSTISSMYLQQKGCAAWL